MALIADIRVNEFIIGRVIAVREEGGIGKMNTYRGSMFTTPHPRTGKFIDVKEVRVQHHYDDDPFDLISKVVAECRKAAGGRSRSRG